MERPDPQLGTQGDVIGRRIVAIIIDGILLGVVSGLVGVLLIGSSPRIGGLLNTLLSPVIYFAYFTYLEGTYGQTLGKKAMDLVVAGVDGSDCTVGGAAIRNLLRIIDWLPVFYLVGIVVIYLTDDRQRLGDVAADTVVVREADSRAAGGAGTDPTPEPTAGASTAAAAGTESTAATTDPTSTTSEESASTTSEESATTAGEESASTTSEESATTAGEESATTAEAQAEAEPESTAGTTDADSGADDEASPDGDEDEDETTDDWFKGEYGEDSDRTSDER